MVQHFNIEEPIPPRTIGKDQQLVEGVYRGAGPQRPQTFLYKCHKAGEHDAKLVEDLLKEIFCR